MNRRMFVPIGTALLSMAALLVLLLAGASADAPTPAQAAPAMAVPTVTEVDPTSAPNDLETAIVVTGTGFTTSTLVLLGDDPLPSGDVGWVSATRLTATVPWGMVPGVYTVTVFNPGEGSGNLPNAFTVTQGLGVWTTGGPYGGYIVGIAKKPGTPTTVYALAMDVGLFASENSGGEWELIYSVDYMSRLAFDSQDADVMYLGTWGSDTFARSLDGGQTWETPPKIGFPGHGESSYPATHPTDAGKVFVGIGDVFGELPPGEGGVFRSDDYGMTWMTKTNGMTDTQVQSIAIHPNDPDKMLAGTWKGNLYVSLDGGETWSLSANLHDPVAGIYFNPYQPLEAWVTGGETVGEPTTYLYTSTNLADWAEVIVEPGAVASGPGYWDVDFMTDTIWASGAGAYTSTDGGATWAAVAPGQGWPAHVLEITPENPQEIYVGHERGVDKSQDGAQTWQQIDEGLAGLWPSMIAVPRAEPDSAYVHTGNGIFRSFNGGHAWQDTGHGGGGYPRGDWLAADPFIPTRLYLGMVKCDDLFCIDISPDAGETWNLVTATLPATFTTGWKDSNVYAIAPHPQIPGRILAGGAVWRYDTDDSLGMVFASDDYGQSWAFMGPTQPISWPVDIAYDAVDPNLVYMATAGTGHWKSTDGGATWEKMPYIGVGWIADEIAPHPTLSGHVVIASEGIWRSQDAGETWTFLPGNVGSPLVYAPSVPPILYGLMQSTQYSGLVRSFDNGQTWEQVADAPFPTRLATGTDGERVVLYIGTPGGVVQIDLDDVMRGAGVYRWTSRLPTPRLYLPLAFRDYAP